MPSPTKRKGSDNWYFRRRLPADIQRIIAALPKAQRPAGWHKSEIWISLRTADRSKAKEKCPVIAAEVEQRFEALREGPKDLTSKQLSALSGMAYRAFAENLEADPVLSAAAWREVAEKNRDAQRGEYGVGLALGIFDSDEDRRAFAMEERFGKIVDGLLKLQGVLTTNNSRRRLIEMLSADLTAAAEKLGRNAEGDYTPDAYANRFPEWQKPAAGSTPSHTLTGLAASWRAAAVARGVTARDAKRMSGVMYRFGKWLGHDEARRVTREDVVRWTDERSAAGIKSSTINKTDTAALRTIFGWGLDRGWIGANPLERNVQIVSKGSARVRPPYFSEDEAASILTAALRVGRKKQENRKTTAAKRWVPWLLAYSGARAAEMIQLRKEDVRREGASWIIRLSPEAGSIKTNEYRDVPVHEHLIETGFIKFVLAAESGHLFITPRKGGPTSGPIESVYSRVLEFVRAVLPDPNVQPNHAWRYTFKTRGDEAEIPENVLDAICGHAATHKGRDYTRVTLTRRIEAITRFPRYGLKVSEARPRRLVRRERP